MAMKENTKNILNYVKEHSEENITVYDIADALGLGARSVNGSVTAMSNRKDSNGNPCPLLERSEEHTVKMPDGSEKKVKFIKITEAGKAFNPEEAE